MEVPNTWNGKEGVRRDVGTLDTMVVIDEETLFGIGDNEVPLESFGPRIREINL